MLIKSNKLFFCVLVLFFLIASIINVAAVESVKIGVTNPLTGPIAIVGQHSMDAMRVAVDIINGEYPELKYGLAPTAGLPNLGGAKIELIVGNTQGKPEYGRSEAERLITINKVVALIGGYQSAVTKTASQIAERYKVPYVAGVASAPDLTERGFKYFFRVSLNDNYYAEMYMNFLEDLNKKKGANIKNLGIFYEDDIFGVNMYEGVKEAANRHGFNLASVVKFPFGSAEMDSEVSILKRDNPDFVFIAAQISDTILYLQTAKKLNYNAPGIAAFGGGLSENDVVKAMGKDVDYSFCREMVPLDLADKLPLLKKINEMYKERAGVYIDGSNVRDFLGMIVLADAINRAGSTDKEAIRQALVETDIPAEQLFLSLWGVKFDEKGQNTEGTGIVRQRFNGELKTVWPFEIAPADIVFPMPKWNER